MTGKQNIVFWLAITMILLNFWTSGQSTAIWGTITQKGSSQSGGSKPPGKTAPGRGVRPGRSFPDPHGFVQLWHLRRMM